MNCSKLIGDRSRFYLHCSTPSSSRNGVTSGACIVDYSSLPDHLQAPAFHHKNKGRHTSPSRGRARKALSGEMHELF